MNVAISPSVGGRHAASSWANDSHTAPKRSQLRSDDPDRPVSALSVSSQENRLSMFRSTYDYLEITDLHDPGDAVDVLTRMVVDADSGSRLFALGTVTSPDDPAETVLCLERGGRRIPFTARLRGRPGWTPLSAFMAGARPPVRPEAGVLTLDIDIDDVGLHPHQVARGLRSGFFAMSDVWGGERFAPMRFDDESERRAVVHAIQQALPALFFDDCEGIHAVPTLVRRVGAARADWRDVVDDSGRLETASCRLAPRAGVPEVPAAMLDRLEQRGARAPLQLAPLMADLIDMERDDFLLGRAWASTVVGSPRLWALLRATYDAYGAGRQGSFEGFLLRVIGTLNARQMGRAIQVRFSRQPASA